MQINFTVFATGVILAANKLRYKAYESDSPLAEVVSVTEDPPHTFPHAVTLNVPNPVVHIVKIFSTPDDSAGTLISEFIYDPTYTNVEIRLPLQLLVGGSGEFDPAADSKRIDMPFLTEWVNLWYPERRANGGTMADFEYTRLDTGGLELKEDDTFAFDELVFIHFEPKITLSAPTYNYINLFTDLVVVTNDVTLDSTYYRKIIELAALGTSITATLPLLDTVPNNTLFVFETMMGNQKQSTIRTQAGEPINIGNTQRIDIHLGECEYAWIFKGPDAYHVFKISDGIFRVGAYVDHDVPMINASPTDGTGLLGSDFPRVLYYISSLPAGRLMSKDERDAGGDSLACYWAYDNATNMIYKPDRRGLHKRNLPGTRGNDSQRDATVTPGSYRQDRLKNHVHAADVDPSKKFMKRAGSKTGLNIATNPVNGNEYTDQYTASAGEGPENTVKTVGVLELVYI